MTENERFLFDRFLISIKTGLESLEDIINDTLEAVEDEGWQTEISEEWVTENIKKEYAKNEEESKTWLHPTDTEKLHTAFDNLCKQNIVALHNAGYERSDAIYDAKEVWKDVEDNGGKPVGYCYYHGQDLEDAIENNELHIGFYGEKDNNDKEAILIGHKVVNALKNEGLSVVWDSTASKRIKVESFNWQNAFTSDDDVEEKWGYERVVRLMTEE